MESVLEKYNQAGIITEVNYSKFFHLAKEHFQINIKNDYDYINGVKESIRFFSLDLPPEVKEIFIPFAEAPVFWIYESSLLNQIEEFMKFNLVKDSYIELHKSIKENYSKWVITKLKSEKDYYATLTVNFIERDINKHNFFNQIIKAIIHTYQSTFYNPVRALELLTNTLGLMNTIRLNDQSKVELKYILILYTGFIHLKENNYEKANVAFKEAIGIKPQGNTAKIYCALTEIILGNEDGGIFLLKEIFNYDIHRLTLAAKTNNSGMFSYFYRNAFIYSIFHEKEFARAYTKIDTFLSESSVHDATTLTVCKESLESFKIKKLDDYYDDDIKKSIAFLEKILQNYSTSTNTLLYSLYPEFQNRYNAMVESIIQNIKELYYTEVREKISTYDNSINESLSAEKHLTEEIERYKIKSRENLSKSIQHLNENFDLETRSLEQKVNELHKVDRFNPRVSLSNNMTYNIIIAFVVFFIGGVAGYSNKTVSDTSEFNSMFTFVLITGSKWGAISFVLGAIISTIMAGVILIERSDMRQKLLRKINYMKIERERLIAEQRETVIRKEKIMCDNFTNSITQHLKRVEELRTQKADLERTLMKQAEEQINSTISDLGLLN
ncbi:MAG: hypothetical protein NTX65_11470 [Ignavibacteriales bacterium]|nr:hypothetical protein [Ignavibacteriales bacterium]